MNIFALILLVFALVLFIIGSRWGTPAPWDLECAGLACLAGAFILLYVTSSGSFHLLGATR